MSYQVRNQRNPDGIYALSYGKGQKKLTATMRQGDGGWRHDADQSKSYETMKACKEAWGRWAAQTYDGQQAPAPPVEGDDPNFETHEDRQALIDEAPNAETAEHRYLVFTNMEDVIANEHQLVGEPYTQRRYRRRIPSRTRVCA